MICGVFGDDEIIGRVLVIVKLFINCVIIDGELLLYQLHIGEFLSLQLTRQLQILHNKMQGKLQD